jgi:hypothetical protein
VAHASSSRVVFGAGRVVTQIAKLRSLGLHCSEQTATAIPLGFMNIIVSRSIQWNGAEYPPGNQPSYVITLSTLGVHSIEDLPTGANAIVHWLKSGPVKWNFQQELITLFGSKVGESQCVDETGTHKILSALLNERDRNVSCLKMKIVPLLRSWFGLRR